MYCTVAVQVYSIGVTSVGNKPPEGQDVNQTEDLKCLHNKTTSPPDHSRGGSVIHFLSSVFWGSFSNGVKEVANPNQSLNFLTKLAHGV